MSPHGYHQQVVLYRDRDGGVSLSVVGGAFAGSVFLHEDEAMALASALVATVNGNKPRGDITRFYKDALRWQLRRLV